MGVSTGRTLAGNGSELDAHVVLQRSRIQASWQGIISQEVLTSPHVLAESKTKMNLCWYPKSKRCLDMDRILLKAHMLSFSSLQVIFISFALIQQGFKGARIQGCPIINRHSEEICMAGLEDFLIFASQQGLRRSKTFAWLKGMTWSEQNVKPDCYVYLVLEHVEQTTKPGCTPRFKTGRWHPVSMTPGQETLGMDNCKTLYGSSWKAAKIT